jgi:hypothetical protein
MILVFRLPRAVPGISGFSWRRCRGAFGGRGGGPTAPAIAARIRRGTARRALLCPGSRAAACPPAPVVRLGAGMRAPSALHLFTATSLSMCLLRRSAAEPLTAMVRSRSRQTQTRTQQDSPLHQTLTSSSRLIVHATARGEVLRGRGLGDPADRPAGGVISVLPARACRAGAGRCGARRGGFAGDHPP